MDISVIVPSKDRSPTLPACLESLLGQTLKPKEIIVVDDHSSDDTRRVVELFGRQGVFYVALAAQSGAQAARNLGISRASCNWIAFQDSDDVWLPRKLEIQVRELKRSGNGEHSAVHCNAYRRDMETGRFENITIGTFEGQCYRKLLLTPGPMFPGLLAPKSKLLQIGLLDEACPAFQEWDTAIRLAQVCDFIHVSEPLFEWRWHGGDAISKCAKRDFRGFHYVIEKHKKEIIRLHGNRGWKRAMATNVIRGLRAGLFDDVLAVTASDRISAASIVGRAFARRRWAPPGAPTLIRVAARLPF